MGWDRTRCGRHPRDRGPREGSQEGTWRGSLRGGGAEDRAAVSGRRVGGENRRDKSSRSASLGRRGEYPALRRGTGADPRGTNRRRMAQSGALQEPEVGVRARGVGLGATPVRRTERLAASGAVGQGRLLLAAARTPGCRAVRHDSCPNSDRTGEPRASGSSNGTLGALRKKLGLLWERQEAWRRHGAGMRSTAVCRAPAPR